MRIPSVILAAGITVALCNTSVGLGVNNKRDRLKFPPNPTMRDLKKRVPDWWGFVRLGRCEQPGSGKYGVNWSHQGPTWGGGLGIYRGTWYAAGSPYRLWSGSIPETILVADAIRDRFGITAWGAWRCFG